MSLYGALFSGVSGLQSQSSAMGAIADNVTNVNTIGYKGTKVNFQTLITKQASSTKYSAGGVQSKPRQGVDIQGLLQSTSSTTDIGIAGNGFFVVNESANPSTGDLYAYTRAGSFKVDKEGYLQNVSGWYMQGWPLRTWDNNALASQVTVGNDTFMKAYTNSDGDTVYINDNIVDGTNLQALNMNTIGGTAEGTTTMSFGANLPAGGDINSTQQLNLQIYDSLGIDHNMDFTFVKRASNSWDFEAPPPEGAASLEIEDQNGAVYSSAGRLDFDGTPIAGNSMTIQAYHVGDGALRTYTINFAAAADDTTVVGAASADLTANVNTTGRTQSQLIDQLATTINAILTDAFGAVSTVPGSWAERMAGTNSIVMRQGSSGGAITVDADQVQDASGDPVTLQGRAYDGAGGFTVAALDATVGWNVAGVNAIEFNGDGTPKNFFEKDATSAADPRFTMQIDWVNGADDMDGSAEPKVGVFMGNYNTSDGMTQFAGVYQINYISQNGSKFGNFAGVSIGDDGIVTALFDNGVTKPIFMIPVATFVNPNGMESLSGNVWIETDVSGEPTVREAGEGGSGTTHSATLEASTVDLGEEFTNMITTQRAYSAAAKIITTTDDMLEELMRVKR
ncbi:MAG: flagellar hook-basal body complex protein [Rhodospirillales bacterium]|nr:flagellar hook-basal body complex protein [Rhodospirillales bacterium]